MSRGKGRIERAVLDLFRNNPNRTFSTDDLCRHAFDLDRDMQPTRAQRVSVLRAAHNVKGYYGWRSRGRPAVFARVKRKDREREYWERKYREREHREIRDDGMDLAGAMNLLGLAPGFTELDVARAYRNRSQGGIDQDRLIEARALVLASLDRRKLG